MTHVVVVRVVVHIPGCSALDFFKELGFPLLVARIQDS